MTASLLWRHTIVGYGRRYNALIKRGPNRAFYCWKETTRTVNYGLKEVRGERKKNRLIFFFLSLMPSYLSSFFYFFWLWTEKEPEGTSVLISVEKAPNGLVFEDADRWRGGWGGS